MTALLTSAFAGFFAYKHVAYSSSLWWQFSLNGDAPRFLRALFGTAVLVAGLSLWRLLAPSSRAGVDKTVTFDQLGLFGLLEMVVFLVLVSIAYAYEWARGGLEWD